MTNAKQTNLNLFYKKGKEKKKKKGLLLLLLLLINEKTIITANLFYVFSDKNYMDFNLAMCVFVVDLIRFKKKKNYFLKYLNGFHITLIPCFFLILLLCNLIINYKFSSLLFVY